MFGGVGGFGGWAAEVAVDRTVSVVRTCVMNARNATKCCKLRSRSGREYVRAFNDLSLPRASVGEAPEIGTLSGNRPKINWIRSGVASESFKSSGNQRLLKAFDMHKQTTTQ